MQGNLDELPNLSNNSSTMLLCDVTVGQNLGTEPWNGSFHFVSKFCPTVPLETGLAPVLL